MTLRLQGRSSPSQQEADEQHRLVGPTAQREVLRRLSRRSSWTSIVHLVAVFTQPVFGFFHKLLRAVRAFLSDIMHCVSSAVSWCDNMSSPIPVSPLLSPVASLPRGRGSRSQRGAAPVSSKAPSEPRSNKESHTSAIEFTRRDAPPAVSGAAERSTECIAAAGQVASESLASRARGVIQPAARWVTETITGLFAAGQQKEQGTLLRQSKSQRQQRLQRQQKPQQKQQQQRQLQRERLQLQLVEKQKQREQMQQYPSNRQKQNAQLSNKQQHQQSAVDGPQPQQQHQQQHSKPLEKQHQQRQAAHSVELEDSAAPASAQEQPLPQAVEPAARSSTTPSPTRRQAAATSKRRQAATRAQASKKVPAESAAARAAALLAATAEPAEAAAQDAAAHSTSASISEADLAPVAAEAAEEAAAKKPADSKPRIAATDLEAGPAEQVTALKPGKGKKRQLANAQTQRTVAAPPSPPEESAAASAKAEAAAEAAAEVSAAASAEAGAAAAKSARTSEAVAPNAPPATSLVEVAKIEGGSGEASGFTVIEGRSRKPKSQQKRQPFSAPEEEANAARQDASRVLVQKHHLHQHHLQVDLEQQKQLPPERPKESDSAAAPKSLAAFKCMATKSSRAGCPVSRGQQWWEREQRQGEKPSAQQQSPKQHQQNRQQRSEEPPDHTKRQEPQRHSHAMQQELERQAASGLRKQHLTQHPQQQPPQEPLQQQQQQQQPPQEPLQQHQHQRPPQKPQQHHQHQPSQEPQKHQQQQQPPQEPQQQQQQPPQEPQQQQQQPPPPPPQGPQQQQQQPSQEPQQQQQQPPRQPQPQLVQQQQQQPSQHTQQQLQQRCPQHQQQHHRTTSVNVLAHSPRESRRNSEAPQRRRGWVIAESAAEAPSIPLPDKGPAQAEGTNGAALSDSMRSNDMNSPALVKENAEAMRATTPAAAAVAAKEGWRCADLHGDRSPRPPAPRKFDKKPDGRASPEARQEAGAPAKPRGPHNWIQVKPAHCVDIERLAPAGALSETKATNAEAVAAIPEPQQRRATAPEPVAAPKAEEEAARHWPTLGASSNKANRRKSASSASRIEQEKPVLQSQRVGAHQHQPRHEQQQQQQCLPVHQQQPHPRATPRAWEAPRYRRGRRGPGGWTSPTEAHRQTTAPVPETLRGSGCASECGVGRCDSVSVSLGTPDAEWGGFEDSVLPRTGRPPKGREPYSPRAGPSSRSAAPTQDSASVAGTYTAGTHASAAGGCSGSCPYLSVPDTVALSAPRGTLASHLIGVESEWWQRQLQQPQQHYQPRNRPYQQGWDRRRNGSVASQLVLRRQLVQQQMVVCDAEFAVLVAVLPDPCYDPYAAAAAAATASYSCPSTTYGGAYAASMGGWGSIGPQTPCHAAYLPPYQPPLKGAFYGPEPPGSLHDYPLQQEPRTPQATPLPGTPSAHLQHTQLSFAAVNGDPEHQDESGYATQREAFHVSAAPGQLPSDAGSAERPAQQLSSPHTEGATNGDTEPPEQEQQMNASEPIQHAAPATEATN